MIRSLSRMYACVAGLALALVAPSAIAQEQPTQEPPGQQPTQQQQPSQQPGQPQPLQQEEQQQGEKAQPQLETPEEVLGALHAANRMEIRAARMAAKRAKDPQVRKYAQMIQREHQAADRKTMALAKELEVKPQQPPQELRQAAQEGMKKLQQAKGQQFDQAYLQLMLDSHDKVISMLSSAAQTTDDQKLRGFLEQQLPALQKHRQQAEELMQKAQG